MTNWSLAALAFGYLLGSIPFGLILTRLAGLGDVRAIGSGNIGATNVLRTGNKKLAAATLLLDALKGTAAVLLAYGYALYFSAGTSAEDMARQFAIWMPAGIGAFLGHLFPVWLKFKGGKGVATYIGVLLGWWWPAALIFCAVWLVVAFTTRYSSLSALVAAVITPAAMLWYAFSPNPIKTEMVYWQGILQLTDLAYSAFLLSALLLWKHRANITRLMSGKEPKIGAKG